MILPPHILKYQKQLQELNKLNTASNANNSSKNANLKSLTISPGELDSEFNPDKFSYAAMVNFDVDKLNNVSALAEDNDAVVTISGNENFKPGQKIDIQLVALYQKSSVLESFNCQMMMTNLEVTIRLHQTFRI